MRMLEPGDVVADKYQVKALLGRGGMGAVYLVRHALTGRRFALKVLAPSLVGHTTAAQRLVREALAGGRIEHRNVVDIFDVGDHQGAVYLVMEYLEGKPLSELLDSGAMSDRAALAIMLRAMEGVAAAHEQGIVHRDLKPENIFVCMGASGAFEEPRVMDFGISRLPEQLGLGDITSGGLVVGTPHFMCLEQLEGRRDLDERVDVYALGVSLFRVLAGRVPFEGDNLTSLTHRIANETPLHLSVLRPDLPQLLAQTVMKAMSRHREDRHPNVRALIRDLEPFVATLSDVPARNRRPPASLSMSLALPATPAAIPALSSASATLGSGFGTPATPSHMPVAALPTVPPRASWHRAGSWLVVAASVPLAALAIWALSRNPPTTPTPAAPSVPAALQTAGVAPTRPAAVQATRLPASSQGVSDARAESLAPLHNAQPARPRAVARLRANPPMPAPIAPRAPEAAAPATPSASSARASSPVLPLSPDPGYDLIRELREQPAPTRKLDESDPYAK